MMTPAELTRVLGALGVVVSEDTQIEWRKKRLLPGLTDRGRGPAAGKDYFYTDARIVERTILVKKLLDASHSSDATVLAIWIKGFDVDATHIWDVWKRHLAMLEQRVSERIVSPGDEMDVLARITARVSREIGHTNNVPRRLIELMVGGFVALAWNSNSIFDHDAREDVSEMVTTDAVSYFQHLHLVPEAGEILPQLNLESGARFLQQAVSLPGLQTLLASTSPNELAQALVYWFKFDFLAVATVTVFVPGLAKADPDPRHDPKIIVGSTIIPLLLYGIRCGRGSEIEASINHVLEIGHATDVAATINRFAHGELDAQADWQALVQLFDGIAKIWGFSEITALLSASGLAQNK